MTNHRSETISEWSYPGFSFQGTFLPIWTALWGLGAVVVGGIWFAAAAGPGPGPFFLIVGFVILGLGTWVYYLRGIRHVSVDHTGQFRFSGPRYSIVVQPSELLSITYWWMDWLSAAPRYVRTPAGSFFVTPGLKGPTDIFDALKVANPQIEIRRRPM